MSRAQRTIADIAIIALLALGVAFVPGGGNASQAAIAVLLIAFMAVLAVAGHQLYRQNQLTIETLPDRERGILCAGVGLLVLTIAAGDKLLNTSGGTLIWIGMLAVSVIIIARVWVEASRY
jgi:Kef-type K+ transport system membrane component KefB